MKYWVNIPDKYGFSRNGGTVLWCCVYLLRAVGGQDLVGVIDSGIIMSHQRLKEQLIPLCNIVVMVIFRIVVKVA